MPNLDMFQARFIKVDQFVWCNMEIIQTGNGMQFTSKEFQESIFVHIVKLALAPPDHQEINGQF